MHDRSFLQPFVINLYLYYLFLWRVLLLGHLGVLESLKCGGASYHSEIVQKLYLSCVDSAKAAECRIPLDLFFLNQGNLMSLIFPA